jgi:hypothetical protein
MLPDLPSIKHVLKGIQHDVIMNSCYENFHVIKVPPSMLWEGNSTSVNRQDTEFDKEEMFSAGASTELNPEKETLVGMFIKLKQMGQQMAENLEPELLRRLDQTLTKYGQVTAPGLDFNTSILDTLNKLAFPVDSQGKIDPSQLQIVLHPDNIETFKDRISKAESDPEFIKQVEDIYAKKQQEVDERENNRKLVR